MVGANSVLWDVPKQTVVKAARERRLLFHFLKHPYIDRASNT